MPNPRIVTGQAVRSETLKRAQQLRREMTPAERILWDRLRANRLGGWHFRRQQIISGFIVDFYCHQADLVIEVDGGVHAFQPAADAQREAVLQARGLRILRFTNDQVLKQLPTVLQRIQACLPPDSPSLPGKGPGDRSGDG
jgi:very-short-patch-repair endonuclease